MNRAHPFDSSAVVVWSKSSDFSSIRFSLAPLARVLGFFRILIGFGRSRTARDHEYKIGPDVRDINSSPDARMKRFIITQKDKETYSAHSGLALAGLCIHYHTFLDEKLAKIGPQKVRICNADIVKSYFGLLFTGKSDYEALNERRNDPFFKTALGIQRVPSTKTLRQRFNTHALPLEKAISNAAVDFLKKTLTSLTSLDTGHVLLTIHDIPLDQQRERSEVSQHSAVAPVHISLACIGNEQWCVAAGLTKHVDNQKATVAFLKKAITTARKITAKPLLVCFESVRDPVPTLMLLRKMKRVSYLVRCYYPDANRDEWLQQVLSKGRIVELRPGKRLAAITVREQRKHDGRTRVFKRVVCVTERTMDRHGQLLLIPEFTLDGWWTSLRLQDEAVCALLDSKMPNPEFPNKFRTRLGLAHFPSRKLATNRLVLSLGVLTYNVTLFLELSGMHVKNM